MDNKWIEIIIKKYKYLHLSNSVKRVSKENDSKINKIKKYFNRLEQINDYLIEKNDEHLESILKKIFYDNYVIKKENIKEIYIKKQYEYLYKTDNLDDKIKNEIINSFIKSQKDSIDKWIEFFLHDEEGKKYNILEKFWIFEGISSLGKYNKETKKFSRRDDKTIYPFQSVNKKYINQIVKLMNDYFNGVIEEEKIKCILGSGDFKPLYEYVIECNNPNKYLKKGMWVKYEKSPYYSKIMDDLYNCNTGWCIENREEYAKEFCEINDFYIYYSLMENNDKKYPRLCIRSDCNNNIIEIRGITNYQGVEYEMLTILKEKLVNFKNKEEYLNRIDDTLKLFIIEDKLDNNEELSILEIEFLYELERKIITFEYDNTNRINNIKKKSNIKNDFSRLFNCNIEDIHDKYQRFDNAKVYIGNIAFNDFEDVSWLKLPTILVGNLSLNSLKTIDNLLFPQKMYGNISLNSLEEIDNLKLPIQFLYHPERLIMNSQLKEKIYSEPSKYFNEYNKTKKLSINVN